MPIIDETYISKLKMQLEELDRAESNASDERDENEVFKKIVRLTNVRDRSTCELRNRFLSDEFPEEAVEEALSRAQRCALIDDMRFADSLIRSRVNAGKGRRGIERELEKHEIEACDVPGWPEEYFASDEDELDHALNALQRKPPRAKNKRDSAYRKLVSQGYSSSIASSAARLWADNLE